MVWVNSDTITVDLFTRVAVSYTHLDVYKRQKIGNEEIEQVTVFKYRCV